MARKRAVHPIAELFPMLADDELAELAEDIKIRGLLQPVVLDGEGQILDGRNRLAACKLARVEPTFTTYEGDDPAGFALAVNIARRHLSTGARAVIAAKAYRAGMGTQIKIGNFADLRNDRISEANLVLDWLPHLADEVIADKMPLSTAVERARAEKKEKAERDHKRAVLKTGASDLLVLVDEERMSLDDATAALRDREIKAKAELDEETRAAKERERQDRDSAMQANTALARSVAYLDAVRVDKWRHLTVEQWQTGLCQATPSEMSRVTPINLREIAEGLGLMASEMEKRK